MNCIKVGIYIIVFLILGSCKDLNFKSDSSATRTTVFIGIDVSGSFTRTSTFKDGVKFLSYYINAHLKGLGGLFKPTDLYVGGIGGNEKEEPQAFYPIHDFDGRSIRQIEKKLKKEFAHQKDNLTDFNEFFRRVKSIVKQKNLVLSPITIILLTDGVAEIAAGKKSKVAIRQAYSKIDVTPLEYLSRNVSIRLLYAKPSIGYHWRSYVPTKRIKIWSVEREVMKGWKDQLRIKGKKGLYKWIKDNVDLRIMSRGV